MATTERMPADRRAALRDRGVDLLILPAGPDGVSLPALLDALGDRGVTSLLVEGGGRVHGAFFAGGLVHKVLAYVAPVIIGGAAAPGPVGGVGALTMDGALRLTAPRVEPLGSDILVTAYVPATTGHLASAAGSYTEATDPARLASAALTPEQVLMFTGIVEEIGRVEEVRLGGAANRLTSAGARRSTASGSATASPSTASASPSRRSPPRPSPAT